MADLVVSILQYGDGKFDRVYVPIESGTVMSKGEAVCFEAGYATAMDAAADDATFLGIAEQAHASAADHSYIVVLTKVIVDSPVESASYTFAEGMKYNTSGTLEADGGANTIAHVWEQTGTTTMTTLKVMIDTVNLGKLFGVDA